MASHASMWNVNLARKTKHTGYSEKGRGKEGGKEEGRKGERIILKHFLAYFPMVLFLFFCVYVFALFAILTLFKTLEDSQLCT